MGVTRGHYTQFRNYGTPWYLGNGRSLKLEIWHAGEPREELTEKNEKLGKWGSAWGHVTQFWNYRTPSYLGNGRS